MKPLRNFEFGNDPHPIPRVQQFSGDTPSLHLDECRKLVAERYLQEGYITDAQIDLADGAINRRTDPYVEQSEYFGVYDQDGVIEATARLIKVSEHPEDWVFPLEKEFHLYPQFSTLIEETRRKDPRSIVEISALAKKEHVDHLTSLEVYRYIWQHAKRTGYNICLISADIRLGNKMSAMFGEAIVQVGEPSYVLGSMTVPLILQTNKCAEAMKDVYLETVAQYSESDAEVYKELINYLRDGLEAEYFDAAEKRQLADIGITID
tara:strand:- start:7019 stop:7810 length:792 start_codon:yes stop_codon:yes gene_type:complete